MTQEYRPRNRPARTYRQSARSRQQSRGPSPRLRPLWLALCALVVLAAAVGVLGAGRPGADAPSPRANVADPPESVSSPPAAHTTSKDCASCHEPPSADHFSPDCASCHTSDRAWSEVQLAHVTFGSHVQATQSCGTCHTGKTASQIACRACHGSGCGKNAKAAGDCLECHRKGTTDAWVPAD